jgi:uncharacterized cofD-like protein
MLPDARINRVRAKQNHKKIVIIGGGTGVFTVLTGLKKHFSHLTAIVSMADSGGSSGVLREEFGILPPGDVRRALVALSRTDNKVLAELMSYRFSQGNGLTGHNFGNLLITALTHMTGNFEKALTEAGKILQVKGKIIPVTLERSHLFAELEDGQVIAGETNIDVPTHDPKLKIENVWLEPKAEVNPNTHRAILTADLVIIGPGDLYTSLVPNLLVAGVPEALRETKAVILYIVNIMTKYGETNYFKASNFLQIVEEYIGQGVIDAILINSKIPSKSRLEAYQEESAEVVVNDLEGLTSATVIARDLIRPRGFIRHDPEKLAQLVQEVLSNGKILVHKSQKKS